MSAAPSLAICGGKPRFSDALAIGQFYRPEWARYEEAARDIFFRRYYVSQRAVGPLVVQLQGRLQDFLGVKHALPVGNAAVGFMIATHVVGLRGRVVVTPSLSAEAAQSLAWSNCRPVLADIDPATLQVSTASLRSLLKDGRIEGLLVPHCCAGAAPVDEIEALASEYDVPAYYDATQAFGCKVSGRSVGTFGQAEVFSFDATNILGMAHGGCLATNDDALAAAFKAMRGDHVVGPGTSVQSATARMSEIQAAVALMMLDDFEHNRDNNQLQHRCYRDRLRNTPGIRVLRPTGASYSNFQNVVGIVESEHFGLSRDQLIAVLRAENVTAEPLFSSPRAPFGERSDVEYDARLLQGAEMAAQTTLQLPIGGRVTIDHIERICDVINEAHVHADLIRSKFGR
jgi:dTDP-4-amino-4,6-dideoxygalactose transaminase